MLKQAEIPQKGSNEQGSVLLAVVCMGMVTMTLATVALGMIQYNTQATARNVERSQAKITAEAALTEFVSSYNGTYDALKTFSAGRSATSTPINVSFIDSSGNDNSSNFGTTKINVFEQGSGFKVTSTCDYMGQVQTASLIFASNQNSPYIPTNTLEASDGSNFNGECWPMDGDMYLERGTDPNTKMKFHDANGGYHSHIYTEYSIDFDTGTKFHDVTNKTGSKNYEPNKSAGASDSGEYFEQAMTIRSTGYMKWKNTNAIYGTAVGKTDENGKNLDDAGYDKNNLSNKDGWLYAENKILLVGNDIPVNFGVGTDTLADGSAPGLGKNPVDMYCHGMYVGTVTENLGGVTNTETSTIDSIYGQHNFDNSRDITVNGNIYCYKGSTGAATQNGDLVVDLASKTFNVYGDLVVEGTLYISPNATIDLHGHKLYAKEIRYLDGSGGVTCDSSLSSHPRFVNASFDAFDQVDPSNTSTRDDIPTLGYSPATGTQDTVRKGLKATYQDASTNKIFTESINNAHGYASSAKDIAGKYAAAMTRTLDTKKFSSTSGVKDLSGKYTSSVAGSNYTVTQINGSVRLREQDLAGTADSDVCNKIYNIKLTDEDIVIAMPIQGMNNKPNTIMRIDSTDRTTDCFVYFMYYDESDCNFSNPNSIEIKCPYLDAIDHTYTVSREKNTGGAPDMVNVSLKRTDYASRASKQISYSNSGVTGKAINGIHEGPGMMIGDPMIWNKYEDDDSIDFTGFIERARGARPKTDVLRTYSQQSQENLAMYLVPDNVKFTINERATIQGIVYAPDSDVTFVGGSSAYSYVFGQVKCRKFKGPGNFDEPMIFNIPPAKNSIMDYVGAVNATTSSIDIAYYQY